MIERSAPIAVTHKRHMSCCERLSMHVMRRQIAMLNNAAALTRLLLQERTSLLRLVESILRDRPAAEDVTQSLWFRVQRIEDDPPILNKRAYLFRLAANLAKDRIRADGRYAALFHAADTLPEEIPADMVGADTELSDRQRLAVTMAAIDELPARTREIFILRKFDELTLDDIAHRIGISRSMVVRHLQQALRHCMTRLGESE